VFYMKAQVGQRVRVLDPGSIIGGRGPLHGKVGVVREVHRRRVHPTWYLVVLPDGTEVMSKQVKVV
jgi:hypothetical protein